MRLLFILAAALFAQPALACIPTPLEQTDTFYRVSFGGNPYTMNFNRLKEVNKNSRANELQEILQFKADAIGMVPLVQFMQEGDPDGYNDPGLPNFYHGDARGRPAGENAATFIVGHCVDVSVIWDPVVSAFEIMWTVVATTAAEEARLDAFMAEWVD